MFKVDFNAQLSANIASFISINNVVEAAGEFDILTTGSTPIFLARPS